MIEMFLFGIWPLELICYLACLREAPPCGAKAGAWYLVLPQGSDTFLDDEGIEFLSTDKRIVSPLVLNGRGGRGSIVMTGEDHRLSG
jgi:hypothetical protein